MPNSRVIQSPSAILNPNGAGEAIHFRVDNGEVGGYRIDDTDMVFFTQPALGDPTIEGTFDLTSGTFVDLYLFISSLTNFTPLGGNPDVLSLGANRVHRAPITVQVTSPETIYLRATPL